MKITGGLVATAGWALADLINMFRDEEQQAQYARNKAVAGKIASTGMAIAGKLNPEGKAGTGTHSKATPSQHAGEGAHGQPRQSNPPGQIARPGVTPESIKAAGESTHIGPPKGWNARQQHKQALAIKNQHPAPPGNGQKPMSNQQAGAMWDNKKALESMMQIKEVQPRGELLAGRRTGKHSSKPSSAEIDTKNMKYDKHMREWVPNIPQAGLGISSGSYLS